MALDTKVVCKKDSSYTTQIVNQTQSNVQSSDKTNCDNSKSSCPTKTSVTPGTRSSPRLSVLCWLKNKFSSSLMVSADNSTKTQDATKKWAQPRTGKNTMTVDVENARQPLVKKGKKMPQFTEIFDIIKNDKDKELRVQVERESLEMVLLPQDTLHYKTALHVAVESAAMDCLQILLDGKPTQEAIDTPCDDGNTSLHVAVSNLNSKAVKMLLDAGAYPNSRNDKGHTALHLLAYKTNSDSVTGVMSCLNNLLLHKDIDLDAMNNSHLTPLQSATGKFPCKSSLLEEFCKKLINHGALVEEKTQNVIDKHCSPNSKPPNMIRKITKQTLAQLYDLLIIGKSDRINEILKNLSSLEAQDIANRYMGSRRILYYLVDKCNEEGVNALLESGAKPWSRNMGQELPLHRALARGHHTIASSLIYHMKKPNMNKKIDLREDSFGLFQKALECREAHNNALFDVNPNECLRRLFCSDVLVDVNQNENQNEGSQVHQTALHIAAALNNQEALAILLENGAYLGEHRVIGCQDHGTVLNTVMPKTLSKAMDNCINTRVKSNGNSEEDLLGPDYTLEMNYGFLLPPPPVEDSKTPAYHNEAAVLFDVSQSKEHRNAIKHPLIQTLLYAKWRRVLPLYALNLIIYFIFVLLLTALMYSLKNLRILERNEQNGNYTDLVRLQDQMHGYHAQNGAYIAFVLIITAYMIVKEGFQIYFTYKSYYRYIENYLEWFLIITVLITCFIPLSLDATRHVAAWAMIAAWYEFVLVLGRAPPLAIYITMLRHVSWNFLKLIFLFGFLIIAFSISFNIILQSGSDLDSGGDFSAFWTTLPRAIVMATGEFEYSAISEELSSTALFAISTVLIFLVFLFLIFLVLMNVMTGLAVTDAKEIVEDALLYSLKSRLELVYLNEQLFLKVGFLRKMLPRLQLLANKQRSLMVQMNKYPKTQRIMYGDEPDDERKERCKLDNRTADILRSHWLDQFARKKAENEGNPTEKILALLKEIKEHTSQ